MEEKDKKLLAAAIKKRDRLQKIKAFDGTDLTSVANPKQQTILDDIWKIQYRYVVAGNQSGKSQTAARELAWVFERTHPTWNPPSRWGTEPLLGLVAGQDRKNMEVNLWEGKIKPLLTNPQDWKEDRSSGTLSSVKNTKTGDQIVFLSHSDGSEKNRKYMQGYVAHWVWLDEMPTSLSILEELQRRVDAKEGRFLATFTPKFRNVAIKKIVESIAEPYGKRYQMSKLDNPIYADRLEAEMAKLAGYSEEMRNTILYGAWVMADNLLFPHAREEVIGTPNNYHPSWTHMEVVDPGIGTKTGYLKMAQDPKDNMWWVVGAEYITGAENASDLLQKVLKETGNVALALRVCDPHETYYMKEAKSQNVSPAYITPRSKTGVGRKLELVDAARSALGPTVKIASWCEKIIDELDSYRESESKPGTIHQASKFHLMDCFQYGVDRLPKDKIVIEPTSFADRLREANSKVTNDRKSGTTRWKMYSSGRSRQRRQRR